MKSEKPWKNTLRKLERNLKTKELKDPMIWFKVFGWLSICFFFTGWVVGAVLEHNSAVKDMQTIFNTMPPECQGAAVMDAQIQATIKKWNITNMNTLYNHDNTTN